MSKIQLIVEGDGDVKSVPLLTRRVLQEVLKRYDIAVSQPHRRGDLCKVKRNFSRFLQMAFIEKAPILWVIDCDDGDPNQHLSDLNELLSREFCPQPVCFALMVKEYESLFLADSTTSKSILKIPDSIDFPVDPESVRGAKEWLSKGMPSGSAYKETLHQEKVTAKLNLQTLRNTSQSYRLFETAVKKLTSSL